MLFNRAAFHFETLEDRRLFAAQLPALSSLPGLFDAIQPPSHPALPAYFDTFAPAVGGAAAGGTPTIAEWSRTAGPDQRITLTADQLGDASTSSAVVFGETRAANARLSSATIDTLSGGAAAGITLPKDLPANSMYLLWMQNSQGYGQAIAINRAEAWWTGPDVARQGGSVAIYGRNLTLGGQGWRAAVYLEPGPGNSAAPRWVRVTGANPYQLTIALPKDLPTGNWQVWINNGHGGNLGWSAPVSLTVNPASAWSGRVFNVKRFGAKGDGRTDDQAAIRAAVDAAEQTPGSTVFLPAGHYLVNGGLTYLHDIRLLGQGMGATTILAGPAFEVGDGDATHECLIFSPTSNVQLANLGLAANGNMAGGVQDLVYARNATDITFTNVRFDARGYGPADIHDAHRICFSNCQIIGKEIFIGTAWQVSFDACHFFMTDDCVAALLNWGGQQLSLTRNTVQNLRPYNPNDDSGHGLGRFISNNQFWGASADMYLAGNRTIGLGVPNSNVGEQVMWEGTVTDFDGAVASATADTVSPSGYTPASPLNQETTVAIVGGKGIGQTRTVSSNAGGDLSLTEPWNVIPDSTSRIVVDTLPHNIAVYANAFGGRPEIYQSDLGNASTGVQLYEGGANVIVDRNVFRMVRAGVQFWSGCPDAPPIGPTNINPMFFSYIVNNVFSQAQNGVMWMRQNADAGILFLGNQAYSNRFRGMLASAITVRTSTDWASLPQTPAINFIDGSFIGPASSQIFLDDTSEGAGGIWLINRFHADAAVLI